MRYITLGEICKKGSSNIAQKDLEGNVGDYEIYGASGFIKKVDFYHQEKPYIAIVKDGAGVGRTMLLPAKSSVIGTMQYILPNDDIDIRYLYYAIDNMNLGKYYMGAAIPHIYFKDYQSELLPMRDIEEQKQIADVLKKVDSLIADRRQQLTKLDELVKSRFVEMFGNCIRQTNIKESGLTISDGNYSSKYPRSEEFVESGIPFIRANNLKNGTVIDEDMYYITPEKHKILIKGHLKPNDVLITTRGNIGQVAIVPEKHNDSNINAQIVLLRDENSRFVPQYLLWALQTEEVKVQYLELQTGTALKQLPVGRLEQVIIKEPPIEQQEQFKTFVEQTDKSKLAVQQSLEKLETLKKSLVQQYFG